ncbi:hypothetical protein Cni_G10202 [Canna indica]|uniref:Uncharacterized protein n=1 Tax=Canna indica TaxID=4628 RepID=A0AAQ3Q9N9_9LILI|nr:hypothetical protein Cni_G10202 [Canna indica]
MLASKGGRSFAMSFQDGESRFATPGQDAAASALSLDVLVQYRWRGSRDAPGFADGWGGRALVVLALPPPPPKEVTRLELQGYGVQNGGHDTDQWLTVFGYAFKVLLLFFFLAMSSACCLVCSIFA